MAVDRDGPWKPLDIGDIVLLFEDAATRWWICGGHALDLHLGRSWRTHDDIDVGVLRGDAPALATLLEGWNSEIAAAGS
jgi:hypothetical protein